MEPSRSSSSDVPRSNPAARPRTADPARDRAVSLNTNSPTFDAILGAEGRRHSGGSPKTQSPFSAMAPVLPLPPLIGPSSRSRTVSAAIIPSATTAMAPAQPQRAQTASRLPDSHRAAQASYAGSIASSASSTNERIPMSRAAAKAAVGVAPLSLGNNVRGRSPSPPLPSAAFSSAMPMEDDRDRDDASLNRSRASSVNRTSRNVSRTPSQASTARRTLTLAPSDKCMFVAASLYQFSIDKERREAGFPYLTYVQGELFDVSLPFTILFSMLLTFLDRLLV